MKEPQGRLVILAGQDLGEGNAGVVVDGDMQVLSTGATNFLAAIAVDAVTRAHNAGQLLDIEVDEVTRAG